MHHWPHQSAPSEAVSMPTWLSTLQLQAECYGWSHSAQSVLLSEAHDLDHPAQVECATKYARHKSRSGDWQWCENLRHFAAHRPQPVDNTPLHKQPALKHNKQNIL